jgi:ABC-type nitrate/sulfonate/bicarbonate transport system substrate-binding protein
MFGRALITYLIGFFLIFSALFNPLYLLAGQSSGVKINLQLKWFHQFQFAGYYMALENGYFRDEGIDLVIKEGSPSTDVVSEVLSGNADFGIGTSDLLLDYVKGKEVVVVGVIYQHSPLVLVTRLEPSLNGLSELKGKKLSIEPHSADLLAMFKHEGVDTSTLKLEAHSGSIDGLKSGEVAAMSAYLTDELYELNLEHVPFLTFTPRSYGIDFYGDNFFTSAAFARKSPELVRGFNRAVSKGWSDAISNPGTAVNLILSKYSKRKTREHLLFEARETISLMTRLVKPGYMLEQRWRHIGEIYKKNGMISFLPDLSGFIFETQEYHLRLPSWFVPVSSGVLLIVFGLIYLLVYFKRLNSKLNKALSEITTLQGILPICAFCKKIRDDKGAWEQIEVYIKERSGTVFSHGICPDCARKEYPETQKNSGTSPSS